MNYIFVMAQTKNNKKGDVAIYPLFVIIKNNYDPGYK